MIDVVVFAVAMLVTLSLLGSIASYVVASWVYPSKAASQIVRPSVMAAGTGALQTAIGSPLSVGTTTLAYVATNVSAAAMLVLCLYISLNMTGSESVFLADFEGTYLALKGSLFDGLLNPVIGLVNIGVTAVLPVTNYLSYLGRITINATLKVLSSSAQDPFVIFRAILAIPKAILQLVLAFAAFVSKGSDGGTFLTNEFSVAPAIRVLQDDVFAVIANQADFACQALTPVVVVARDIMISPHFRDAVDRGVNAIVHNLQGIARIATTQKVDFTAGFAAVRDAANSFGLLLDQVLESVLNLVALPRNAPSGIFQQIKLPGPSLGSAVGRGISATANLVEMAVGVAAISTGAAFESGTLYRALDSTSFRREAHLAVLSAAAGLDHMQELVYTGSVGRKSILRCDYWGYNFFADENVMETIPESCMCQGNMCGKGGTCVSTGVCECLPGYHHVINGSLASRCVPTCHRREGTNAVRCGKAFGNMTQGSAGTCQLDSGYCRCHLPAVYDLRSGLCAQNSTVPASFRNDDDLDQNPKPTWGDARCLALLAHELDRPLPCTVQAAGLTALGTLVVGWEFAIDVLFNADGVTDFFNRLPRLAQTYDGVWYPRFQSVSCTYRRDEAFAFDRSMLPDNCRCEIPTGHDASGYDPYCGRPTLNANVYANMDRFAFYAGRNLPFKGVAQLQYVFVGGTGSQRGFLVDTLGAWATASARSATEFWRVLTHTMSGMVTYVLSTAAAVSFRGRNLLQKPNNCDWGLEFDGPVRPKYTAVTTEEVFEAQVIAFKEWKPCDSYCTKEMQERYALILLSDLDWAAGTAAVLRDLNRMHEARVIHARNLQTHDGHDATCARREYTSNAGFCETSNDDNTCMCNPLLAPADKCLCIAFYPQKQAYAANMTGSYKSTFMASFYGTSMPWCHSMFLEWRNFNQMSMSVGMQNMWARMVMANPFADEIKSDCFDESETYNISPYSLLTRLFQPDPEGEGYIAVGNNMISPQDLAICQALRRSKEIRWYKKNEDNIGVTFASHGRCFAKNHKEDECIEGGYDLRELALRGFPNPYKTGQDLMCYQDATFVGVTIDLSIIGISSSSGSLQPPVPVDLIAQVIDGPIYKGDQAKFCKVALAGGLTAADGFGGYEGKLGGWTDVPAYRERLEGFKIGQGIALLHPITCGPVARSESLVFQPCRMSCETSSGADMCWCKNIVHHDFRCNIANMQREFKWNAINSARQASTNRISILGMIPNGVIKDDVLSLCDRDRFWGHNIAIAADLLTGGPAVSGARNVRVKIARALFNIHEYTSGAQDYVDAAMNSLAHTLVSGAISSALGDTSMRCASGRNMCRSCKKHKECWANPSEPSYCYPPGECPTAECCTSGWLGTIENGWPRTIQKTHWYGPALFEYYTPDCFKNLWVVPAPNGKCYSKRKRCQDRGMCTPPVCAPETVACTSVASDAGKIWAQQTTIDVKQTLARYCTLLQGLQLLMFDLGTDQTGGEVIPTVMKVIDIFAQVFMERVMTKAVLVVRVASAFMNALVDPSGQAFLDFFKPLLALFVTLKVMLVTHAMKFIMLVLDMTPAPIGPLVKAAAGTVCRVGFSFLDWVLALMSNIPFVSAVFPGAGQVAGLSSLCLTTGANEADSPILHEDYARRRLGESHATEYEHFRNVLDWNGTTVCAKYGRRDEPPENEFSYYHWQQCVANRIRVVVLRQAFQRDYFPWTLYDDYQQALGFAMKVAHAVVLHATHTEAWLQENRKDLPVDAAQDVINMVRGMRLPMAPLEAVRRTVHEHYPHHVNDSSSIGFEVLRIVEDVRTIKVPHMDALRHWDKLPGHLHRAVTGGFHALQMPRGVHAAKHGRPHYARRRLAEEDVAPAPEEVLSCPEGGESCINCEVFEQVASGVINISAATADFYEQDYPGVTDYFVDLVKHYQHGNPDSPYAPFPGVDMAYTPKPSVKQPPAPALRLDTPDLLGEQDWGKLLKDFFSVVDDTKLPVFQYSFWYYVRYPMRPCDFYGMNYGACQAPRFSVGDAITATLRVMVGVWTTGFLTGLPLPFLLQVPLIGTMYMIFRYGWVPRCLPMLPPCLLTDLHAWIDDALPDCLCQMVPALVINSDRCTRAYCTLPTTNIVYQNCPVRELGLAWPAAYLLRWQVPWLFQAALTSDYLPDLSEISELRGMLEDLRDGVETTPLDRACCTLEIVDVLLLLLAVKFLLVLLQPVSRGAVQLLVGNLGSLAVTMPFLLLRLPEMAAEDDEDGVMLRGWDEPATTVVQAAPDMTLDKAVELYTRNRIMQPQGDDFLRNYDADMQARVVESAWRDMGSPEGVKTAELQAALVRRFEAEGGEEGEDPGGKEEV
jgi:hypothetical protein